MKKRVAVIDVGSNSIKALVAEEGDRPETLVPVYEQTKEVRISAGISGNPPQLRPDLIEDGVQAVADLWRACQSHGPIISARIVATAAVRDAANGATFADKVASSTSLQLSTLSGEEEADAIAHGVLTDPTISRNLHDFTVFDLGGGSLELIVFKDGKVSKRISLRLGSVRLSEMFFSRPNQPIPQSESEALDQHVRQELQSCGLGLGSPLVGCSGGLTALRAMRAREEGIPIEAASPVFHRAYIEDMGQRILAADRKTRIDAYKLPEARADIFPAAFVTFKALLDLAGTDQILHSMHNLRYGLASRMLSPEH